VLEEYGVLVKRDETTGKVVSGQERRRTAYTNWNNLLLKGGGNAAMFWLLAGVDPTNKQTGYYQDYDHFSVYNVPEDETAKLVRDYAAQFQQGARACELAVQSGVSGPSSPFISATKKNTPLAVSWLE
jgi:endo-1,4-beta-mannosidase